jgi:hypothetical protein
MVVLVLKTRIVLQVTAIMAIVAREELVAFLIQIVLGMIMTSVSIITQEMKMLLLIPLEMVTLRQVTYN